MINYIKNMENRKEICVYNIENAQFYLTQNEDGNINTNKGFFTKVDGNLYGVMESHRGPAFFCNEKIYYLSGIDYQFSHCHLERKTGKFQLSCDGKICVDVIYQITPYTDYDAWSSEKDVDFFQWVCQSQEDENSKERFHTYYTT